MPTGRMIGPSASIARSLRYSWGTAGTCLWQVANWVTNGRMLGTYAPSAIHAWYNAKYRYTTGTPPAGAFVFFRASNHPYGHIALSLGGGKIRHLGWGGRTHIGTSTIYQVTTQWRYVYLGWSRDLYGQINVDATTPTTNHAYPGHIHKQGSVDVHVGWIQAALNRSGYSPRLAVDNHFGAKTRAAVLWYQRKYSALTDDGIVGKGTWSYLKP